MVRHRSQRTGRKNSNERIRELVALMGSLSRTGDSITIDALSTRLGISQEDAHAMMDIVCQASGEDMGGLLISSNDDETEFTLQYPGVHGVPIRLTVAETIAIMHALDVAGIDEKDPLREHLQSSFTSADVVAAEVRKSLGGAAHSQDCLYICAQAQVEGRIVTFSYRGLKDVEPRIRKALVLSLSNDNGVWYVHALDLDLEERRTFRADRITEIQVGNVLYDRPDIKKPSNPKRVCITFANKTYYTSFNWPGLRITDETPDVLHGEITYYGECSTWLLRRICAGGGSITVDDERIMLLAKEYARSMLAGGQSPLQQNAD